MPITLLALFHALLLTAHPRVPTLTITATDYAYSAPDTVAAGVTRVRLVSRGREPHIVQLVRLDPGHTTEELFARMTPRSHPAWATFVGGPSVPPPGGASEVVLDLAPGTYALFCPIPSPADHTPHMAKGMVRTLVVVPNGMPNGAPNAAPDATTAPEIGVTLDDYGFLLAPAPTAGRRTLRVENRAAQPHELAIFRLAPGRRAEDVVRWAQRLDGPPPGDIVGGTTALTRGQVVRVPLELRAGTYALLCFVADAKDGKSHVSHGMTREIVVR